MHDLLTFNPIHDALILFAGMAIGFSVGFIIWHKRRNDAEAHERLSKLQTIGVILFLAYWASPLVGLPRLSDIMGLGILAIIVGEKTGVVLAQIIEKYLGRPK